MVAILLVIRVAFIEQFVVTTGSMAPLILGVHRQCDCPKCGFPVVVGAPHDGSAPDHYSGVKCPNCGAGDLGLENLPDQPGQRLWVDKSAYEWRAPRRWELAVFRGADDRGTLYVKRVVGLPGETVRIKDGEVYIDGELCRMPLGVMLATRHHFGNSLSSPLIKTESEYCDAPTTHRITALGTKTARVTFSLLDPAERMCRDYWEYNGAKVARIEEGSGQLFSFQVTPQSAPGMLRVYFGGRALGPPIQVGSRSRIDVAFKSDRWIMAVNGGPTADDWQSLDQPANKSWQWCVELNGDPFDMTDLRFSRLPRYQSAGRHGIASPCRLGPDEYFMLGDNSADSDDSRFWPEPGVPASRLIGRPMFLKR